MMAVDVRQLNKAEVIDVRRAEAASDRQIEANRSRKGLLSVAQSCVERSWYAITVASHAEIAVENALINVGFEAFAPCRKVERMRRVGRYHVAKKVRNEPAFPGYVFGFLPSIAEGWAWLRFVEGVRGAVCGADGRPVTMRATELNCVKELIAKGWLDQTTEAKRKRNAEQAFEMGQMIKIEDGPLRGLNGVFEGYIGTRHVRLLTWLFGRQATIKVDLAQIIRAE